ncbi:MAG TPA: hypothetical protein DEP87_03545 [Candidatus Pacebacteria bacterium]|nr:hypothetical protein [Candidatus Paceibacterota bacterium]
MNPQIVLVTSDDFSLISEIQRHDNFEHAYYLNQTRFKFLLGGEKDFIFFKLTANLWDLRV